MAFKGRRTVDFARGIAWLACGAAMLAAPRSAEAQAPATAPGFYIEAEGQRVFGGSDFQAGLAPDASLASLHALKKDEGDGWGGALAVGYAWHDGWRAALRYRRLEADTGGGPMEPMVIAFVPSLDLAAGGAPLPLYDVLTQVESKTSFIDLLAGKEIPAGAGRLELFGGLTYAAIDRDVSLVDCSCSGLAVHYGSSFEGVGPKIGFRGGIPVSGGLQLVGGGSMAVLFGRSEFKNFLSQPDGMGLPVTPVTDKDSRTVGAFDAEAGLAFAIGTGTLTLGYRIDAWLGALDTDQRVSKDMIALGVPPIGDRHDDFVAHGPFARFAMPLAGAGD
jgi:hypothetical protein